MPCLHRQTCLEQLEDVGSIEGDAAKDKGVQAGSKSIHVCGAAPAAGSAWSLREPAQAQLPTSNSACQAATCRENSSSHWLRQDPRYIITDMHASDWELCVEDQADMQRPGKPHQHALDAAALAARTTPKLAHVAAGPQAGPAYGQPAGRAAAWFEGHPEPSPCTLHSRGGSACSKSGASSS